MDLFLKIETLTLKIKNKFNPSNFTKGFTSVEMMACLTVIIQLIVIFSTYAKKGADQLLENLAAEQLATVQTAARYYVQDNFQDLVDEIKSASQDDDSIDYVEISIDLLKKQNYLDQAQSEKNVFQQKYGMRAMLKNIAHQNAKEENIFQVLIYLKEGETLKDVQIKKIANSVGGTGGYLSSDTLYFIGACQGWKLARPSNLLLTAGHNVALSYVSQKNILGADAFLRRYATEGSPDYNVMHAHLGLDQKYKVQFLDADMGDDLSVEDSQRTCLTQEGLQLGENFKLTKEGLQLGENCKLTPEGLYIKDADGNELTILPSQIVINNPVKKTNSTLTPGSLSVSDVLGNGKYAGTFCHISEDGTGNSADLETGSLTLSSSNSNNTAKFMPTLMELSDNINQSYIALCTCGVGDILSLPPTTAQADSIKNGVRGWFLGGGTDAPFLYFGANRTNNQTMVVLTLDGFVHNYNNDKAVGHKKWDDV